MALPLTENRHENVYYPQMRLSGGNAVLLRRSKNTLKQAIQTDLVLDAWRQGGQRIFHAQAWPVNFKNSPRTKGASP